MSHWVGSLLNRTHKGDIHFGGIYPVCREKVQCVFETIDHYIPSDMTNIVMSYLIQKYETRGTESKDDLGSYTHLFAFDILQHQSTIVTIAEKKYDTRSIGVRCLRLSSVTPPTVDYDPDNKIDKRMRTFCNSIYTDLSKQHGHYIDELVKLFPSLLSKSHQRLLETDFDFMDKQLTMYMNAIKASKQRRGCRVPIEKSTTCAYMRGLNPYLQHRDKTFPVASLLLLSDATHSHYVRFIMKYTTTERLVPMFGK